MWCSLTRTIKAAYAYTLKQNMHLCIWGKIKCIPFSFNIQRNENIYYDSLRNKCKKITKEKRVFFCLYLSASHSLINLCKSIEFEIYIFHRKDRTISFHSMWNPILTLVFFRYILSELVGTVFSSAGSKQYNFLTILSVWLGDKHARFFFVGWLSCVLVVMHSLYTYVVAKRD